jgi:isopenicillin-N epimerase
VHPDRQKQVHPAVISHYLDDSFVHEFGWQGTRDISAWLTTPAALQFMADLGWEHVMDHNHRLAAWAHRMLCARFNSEPITPLDGSLIGSTATVRLPGKFREMPIAEIECMQQRLYSEFKIEVPLMRWNDQAFLRVSCQVYNVPEDYERLADGIEKLA